MTMVAESHNSTMSREASNQASERAAPGAMIEATNARDMAVILSVNIARQGARDGSRGQHVHNGVVR